ncbi:MAG TPA: sucrase ferredoxin [Micromonosporaceae bacterium]
MNQGDEQGIQGAGGRGATGFRCSHETRRRNDPLLATASRTTGWLLIEEPGGWGRDALTESAIDPGIAATLAERTTKAEVRVQLIRRPRPRQRRDRTGQRAVAVVRSEPGGETVSWHTVRADHELLDVPLEAAGGKSEPIYLVCTHGNRDVCCAIRGRPVADHLASHRPDQTWETSHVGGHRFAANLVVLPHGLYYGQVTPDEALAVVKAYEAGQVIPGHLRGRSGYPSPVQAAEHFARVELGETRLDALAAGQPVALDPDTWQVPLARDTGPVTVTVRAVPAVPVRMSCRDEQASPYNSFELVALTTG